MNTYRLAFVHFVIFNEINPFQFLGSASYTIQLSHIKKIISLAKKGVNDLKSKDMASHADAAIDLTKEGTFNIPCNRHNTYCFAMIFDFITYESL